MKPLHFSIENKWKIHWTFNNRHLDVLQLKGEMSIFSKQCLALQLYVKEGRNKICKGKYNEEKLGCMHLSLVYFIGSGFRKYDDSYYDRHSFYQVIDERFSKWILRSYNSKLQMYVNNKKVKQTERIRHMFLGLPFFSEYDNSESYCDHQTFYVKGIMKLFDYVSLQMNSWRPNWALYIIKSVTCKITPFTNDSINILSDLILNLQERVSLSRFL